VTSQSTLLPLRIAPPLRGLGPARFLVERNLLLFRRQWWILISGFFEPLFYLLSIGVGVAELVGMVPGDDGRPISYTLFIAPAMLASSAMNGAVTEVSFNVFFKLKYAKTYEAVLATPVSARDVAVGEVTWALIRGLMYSAMFLMVMLLLGLVRSWWALLALPAAVLIGFAFAAAGMAATTFMRSWQDFEFVNLATLPMFLFSATFYPLSAYPAALQWVVQATPLYHGVALLRALVTGAVSPSLGWQVAYLAVMGLVGVVIAGRRLEKLLLR
jgi:lipooligosaccharide transport system permease protein